MTDKQNNQSNKSKNAPSSHIEDSAASSLNKSSGIRSNLISSQVDSGPLVNEGIFANENHEVKPTKVTKIKGSKNRVWGLAAVILLLALSGLALFFTYGAYQTSFKKIQQSKLANNIDTTSVDLTGSTSSGIQGIGILQVNGDANISGNVTANTFNGSGADLTNLNANNITSGTLSDARLSPNVALLDANQTFTGANNFAGNNTYTGSSNFSGPASFTGSVSLPGTLVINSLTYNLPATQAAGTLTNDGSGNLTWSAGAGCVTCVVNGGNAFGSTVIIGSTDAQNMNLITNGVTRVSFDTLGNVNFTGTINGNGSGITNLNASNISSGTLNDARLSTNVTLAGNIFNGALELVKLDGAGALPALNGAALTNLDASNITAGTLNDLRLSSNVTLQGNTFNVANKLVQLTAAGFFPALNGSLITNLNASNLASGTVPDARLSANVALLNANQTFSGNNTFSGTVTAGTITTTGGLTVGSTSQSLALQGNGSTSLSATSGGFTTSVNFVAPTANVTYRFDTSSAGTYDICTTVGNCASAGGGVTTLGGTTNKLAKFTGLQSIGDSSITDDGSQVTVQTGVNGTGAFRVLNTGGGTTVLDVDTTNNRVGIGTATPSYPLDVVGDINSSTGLRVGGTLVCDNTGCNASGGGGFYIQNTTTVQASANFAIQSAAAASIGAVIRGAAAQTADLQQWQNSGTAVVASVDASGNINTTGQFRVGGVQISSSNLSDSSNLAKLNGTQSFTGVNTFQNSADSTAAFKIQNAAGSSNLFIADTTNTRIGFGTASPGYTVDVNGDLNIAAGSYFRIGGTPICGPTASCAPASGSSSYIQNTTSQQTLANFNIQSINSASIVGVLQGITGQTANLLELRSGAGNTVVQFANSGALTLGNDIASPNAGSIVFNDGTGINGFTSTLSTATLNANRGISLPDENGTICLQNSAACGFASSSGGGNYIQNQSASAQTANFWIDGTGRLATSVLTPTVDVISAGTLSVGNTTATALTLGKSGITTTNSGALTVSQLLTGNLGLTVSGAAVSLNDSSNFTVSVASGTSTGQVNIGNGASNQVLNFGTGGGIKTVTLGSTNTTSTTTINGGTGAGAISLQAGSGGTILFGTVNNNAITTGTGVLTVAGDANLNGNTTIGDATTDRLTVTSQILGATPLVFQGTTDNAFTTSFAITDPTVTNKTITFANESGTVCTTATSSFCNSSSTGYFQNGGNSFGATATLGTNDVFDLAFETSNVTRFTLSAGSATLTGNGATTLTSSSNVTVDSGATLSLGNTNATALTLGRTGITTTNSGALTVSQLLTGNLGLTVSGAAVSLNDSSNFNVSIAGGTSTGQVNIGNGASTQTLNFGTGGGIKTVTVGSTTTTSNTTINAGDSGTITIGSSTLNPKIDIRTTNNSSTALNIQSGNNSTITVQTGTGGILELQAATVNIAKTTGNKDIQIGTSTGDNTIALGGTGINTITFGNTQTAGSIAMGAAMTSGTIAIGGSAMTTGAITIGATNATGGTVNIGTGTGAQTINLGTGGTGIKTIAIGGTAANVITIGNTQTAGSIAVGAAMTTGTITIGGASQTGTITIGQSTDTNTISIGAGNTITTKVQTINIGTGTPVSFGYTDITVGNINVASKLSLRAGTGNINIAAGSTATIIYNTSGNLFFNNADHRIEITDSTGGAVGGGLTITSSDGSTSAAANTAGSAGGAIAISAGAGGGGSATNANGGAGGAMTFSAGAGGTNAGVAVGGVGGALNLNAGNGGGNWNAANGGAVTITAGSSCVSTCVTGSTGAGGAVNINAGTGASSNGFGGASVAGGSGGAFVLAAGAGGNGNNGGSGTQVGGNGGALTISAGAGGGGSGAGSVNGAGGGVTINAGSGFGGGGIALNAGSVAGGASAFGGYITMKTYSNSNYGLDLDATAVTSGTGLRVQASGVTNGNGLAISATATGLTGNALSVTTGSTGVPANGLVRFNFNGARTAAGNGFQIDDISTTLATTMQINANSLTTGKGLVLSSNGTGITTAGTNTGTLLDVRATGANTAFTGSLANIVFDGNNSGNTGALLNIASTGANSKVQSLLITNNQTVAPSDGMVRFNFSGARTAAGNGFQIDDVSTTLATTMAIRANSLTTGVGLSISATSLTAQANDTDTAAGAAIRVDVGSTTARRYIEFTNAGTIQGSITKNGVGAVSYNIASDERLKENIIDTHYSLDTVLALQVHDYNFIADGDKTKLTGFIAQELYTLFPDAVTPGNNAVDENGVLQNPWSVDYGKLTPLLAKGIQDLNTKVDTMKNGLDASVLQSLASANAITINGTLTINGRTIFNNEVSFDKDTAGSETIATGDTTMHVAFSKTLSKKPVVNATPQDFIDGGYKVVNVAATGFDIVLQNAQTADVVFSWQALISQ